MRKPLLAVLVAAIAVAVAVGVWLRRAPEPSVVRIGYSPYVVNLPLFLAADAGLFEAGGINAELIPFQSTDQMALALRQGKIDVASALTAESVYAVNAKSPRTLTPFYFNLFSADSAVDAIVVGPDSSAQSVRDLADGKVAVLPADMMRLALAETLAQERIADRVEVLSLPPASILAALGSGEVSGCYILEPLVTIAEQKLNARVLLAGPAALTIADPLPAGFHSVGPTLKNNPDLVARLAKVYADAATRADNRPRVVAALEEFCSLAPDVAQDVRLPSWSSWSPDLDDRLRAQFTAMAPLFHWDETTLSATSYAGSR